MEMKGVWLAFVFTELIVTIIAIYLQLQKEVIDKQATKSQ